LAKFRHSRVEFLSIQGITYAVASIATQAAEGLLAVGQNISEVLAILALIEDSINLSLKPVSLNVS
jgi:hypothetical protein